MSGRLSDLGTSGRNGVIIAVEQINEAGGINGRSVVLITKDDQQDTTAVVRGVKELIDAKAAAIIGPMTSDMALAAVPLVNEAQLVTISPTASTNKLDDKDDFFLRVNPPDRTETDHLARQAFEAMGLRRIAVIYDLSNRSFSEGVYRNFKSAFDDYGKGAVTGVTFTSGPQADFIGITRQAILSDTGAGVDGILIIAEAVDTALICQQIKKHTGGIPIFATGWAMTQRLIEHGGRAVEGVIFSHYFDQHSQKESYRRFQERYAGRFGAPPDFIAGLGYNAAQVVFQALVENGDPARLKQTILEKKSFDGVQGHIQFTQYGECFLERFLLEVKNGRILARK